MNKVILIVIIVVMISLIAWGISEIGQQMNIENDINNFVDNTNSDSDNNIDIEDNDTNEVIDDTNEVIDDTDEVIDDTDEVIDDTDEVIDDKEDTIAIDFYNYPNDALSWWYVKKAGVEATVTKEIEDILEEYNGVYKGDTSEKVIYLTFDEGYEFGFTPSILDTLKENDVKAAFFITSYFLSENEDYVKRMVDEGHTIGNHSVNHPKFNELETFENMKNEVIPLNEKVNELFGYDMKYFRTPSGMYSERVLKVIEELGFKSIFWSFAYRDWETDNQKGADYAYDNIMPYMHNGCIILLHAVSEDNALVLDRLIKDLKEQGYRFASLDEL